MTGDSRPQDTDSTIEIDGVDVKTLVERLNKKAGKVRSKQPGGNSREKYTCKCCGTRVDSGTHQCSMCEEAGCTAFSRRCKYRVS